MPYIEIKSCKECSDRVVRPDYTEDSWERPEKWICTRKKSRAKDAVDGYRIIVRYHEWNDKDPGVPNWCPKLKGE